MVDELAELSMIASTVVVFIDPYEMGNGCSSLGTKQDSRAGSLADPLMAFPVGMR